LPRLFNQLRAYRFLLPCIHAAHPKGERVNWPRRTTFPLAEGVGIFVGIVAWDLLVDGHMEIFRSVLIAAFCSLVWYAIRHWRGRARSHHRHGTDVS